MARAALTVTTFVRAGVVLPAATVGDAVNFHSATNDGRVGIIVNNTGATSHTVTFHTAKSVDGLTPAARVETIPAGQEQGFGPFDAATYGTTLNIDVDHAELTLRAIRI